MQLRKALEIINYYAYTILNLEHKLSELKELSEDETDELKEAKDVVQSFLNEFK